MPSAEGNACTPQFEPHGGIGEPILEAIRGLNAVQAERLMQRRRQCELETDLKQARFKVGEHLSRGDLSAIFDSGAQIDPRGVDEIRSRVEHERDAGQVRQNVGKNCRPALAQRVKIALPACFVREIAG